MKVLACVQLAVSAGMPSDVVSYIPDLATRTHIKISIREPKMKMKIKIAMKISIREPSSHSGLRTTS